MNLYSSFKSISRPALKYKSYFDTYEVLLNRYKGQKVTFVEVGVLGGGSLQAWRNYFHPDSRIIGIDLNDSLKVDLEKEGFEIYIGDQSNSDFWDNFYSTIGNIDILIDDGGHTNYQQTVTFFKAIPWVNNNGIIIIEDVHTSYLEKFLNPSRYSFINYVKFCIDIINDRYSTLNRIKKMDSIKYSVQYISIFESIIAFHIDRAKCYISSEERFGNSSNDIQLPIDFRELKQKNTFFNKIAKHILPLFSNGFKKGKIASILKKIFYFNYTTCRENYNVRPYFKNKN
jgi:hypothetical protein